MKHKAVIIKYLKNYSVIIFGCVIYSLGVALFLDPYKLAAGGATGIAIILNAIIENLTNHSAEVAQWVNTGTILIVINIPLFILGAIYFGRKFILSTIFSTVVSSLMIYLLELLFANQLPLIKDDILISAVVGGALYGGGLGLIFRMGSTTGGTDIVVKLLRKKFRYLRTGIISMGVDMIIIAFSTIVFKDLKLTCYTVISIVAFTIAFDMVLYGGNSAKLVYIITDEDKIESLKEKILKELDISATLVNGQGAYSGQNKCVVMCAIKNILYPKLRDVVREVDPNAFTIVTSAKEIYGEGYKNHNDDEL